MPLYDFRCSEGHTFERHVPLANFSDPQNCSCGSPAQRLISRPMFSVESVGYNCPITGSWIGSKKDHQENLARHGCRVLETGETSASAARRQAADTALDAAVEATVEKEIETMSSDKRETLYNELTRQGVDAVVTRATV